MSDAGHYASRKLQHAYERASQALEAAVGARVSLYMLAGSLGESIPGEMGVNTQDSIDALITLREALEGLADRIGVKLEKEDD